MWGEAIISRATHTYPFKAILLLGMYFFKKILWQRLYVVMYIFNPSTLSWRQVDLCKFKASLIYLESLRPLTATKGDPVFKTARGRTHIPGGLAYTPGY